MSIKDIFKPKPKEEMPTLEEYKGEVARHIDSSFRLEKPGEIIVDKYDFFVESAFDHFYSPFTIATVIVNLETYNIVRENSYIGGDTQGKLVANRVPIRRVEEYSDDEDDENENEEDVNESVEYKKGMVISVNGRWEKTIKEVEEYPRFNLIHFSDGKIFSSEWLDRQDIRVISELKRKTSSRERWKLGDKANELERELSELRFREENIRNEMKQELADYDESTYKHSRNPRYSLKTKEKEELIMPHNYYGNILQEIDDKREEIIKQLRKLYGKSEPEEELTYDEVIRRKKELDEETDSPTNPFELTEDEKLIDETLKIEEDKPPYVPELLEKEDIENELELMNYEEDDEPQDEYVFHIKMDEGTEDEIIAKVYRDNEDDYWTVRVVKGDEEPLQSMKFDPVLDKLDIIGYLADMYNDVETIDHKEYEYLISDKDKVDKEYYEDIEGIEEQYGFDKKYYNDSIFPVTYKKYLDELIDELSGEYGVDITLNSNNGIEINSREVIKVVWKYMTLNDVRYKLENILKKLV